MTNEKSDTITILSDATTQSTTGTTSASSALAFQPSYIVTLEIKAALLLPLGGFAQKVTKNRGDTS